MTARVNYNEPFAMHPGFTFRFDMSVQAQAQPVDLDTCGQSVTLISTSIPVEGDAVKLYDLWFVHTEANNRSGDQLISAPGTY